MWVVWEVTHTHGWQWIPAGDHGSVHVWTVRLHACFGVTLHVWGGLLVPSGLDGFWPLRVARGAP